MILQTLCVGQMQVNCYILAQDENSSAIIIDPGDEERKIKKALTKHNLKPAFVINTHGHIDHIGCDDRFGVPVYIHQKDLALLKNPELNLSGLLATPYKVGAEIRILQDKEDIKLDALCLEVIHTPGHTPGGICLWMKEPEQKVLFTGDTLFCQGIGRTDVAGADSHQLIESIKEKLFKLSDDAIIYPGHGPSSTIGEEKASNPFLF